MDSTSEIEPAPSAIALPTSQVTFIPLKSKATIPADEKKRLENMLDSWRQERYGQRPKRSLTGHRFDLPNKQLKALVEQSGEFLREQEITPGLIQKFISWDLASQAELNAVVKIICEWRVGAIAVATPSKRKHKKARPSAPDVEDDSDLDFDFPGGSRPPSPTQPLPALRLVDDDDLMIDSDEQSENILVGDVEITPPTNNHFAAQCTSIRPTKAVILP
ncbi:hypothetical protein BDN72DRAFT_676097 [Pluteus cervinus]|uniref:Uncharacterized protein n=1 Tax=Pluteus cervinus TaxID=181527 RepID=A0ACD3A1R7_9AGAR|nr:hypothetical protein BDN72DRAFT_676097 [Pluteus cervinus]